MNNSQVFNSNNFSEVFLARRFSYNSSDVQTTEDLILSVNSCYVANKSLTWLLFYNLLASPILSVSTALLFSVFTWFYSNPCAKFKFLEKAKRSLLYPYFEDENCKSCQLVKLLQTIQHYSILISPSTNSTKFSDEFCH